MTKRVIIHNGRAHDVRVKTLHIGAGFQSTGPVQVEVSKEMRPVHKVKELGPADYRAIRQVNNVLAGFGFKVRLVKPKTTTTGMTTPVTLVEAGDGDTIMFGTTDYLKLISRFDFTTPEALTEHITQLAVEAIKRI